MSIRQEVQRPTSHRTPGLHGELALRSRDGHHEIISNGVMLMDTRNGASERLLVRAALARNARARSVLIGGLGVGFSLAEAIASGLPHITVVECERAIIDWNRTTTGAVTGGSVDDPHVDCVHADLTTWLPGTDRRFDVICLDIDNGPAWTVGPSNAWLYSEAGLCEVRRHLHAGGVLSVWSAEGVDGFRRRLERVFGHVSAEEVAVPRGEPDVVYVAQSEPDALEG